MSNTKFLYLRSHDLKWNSQQFEWKCLHYLIKKTNKTSSTYSSSLRKICQTLGQIKQSRASVEPIFYIFWDQLRAKCATVVLCYICSSWILIPIIIVQNWCAAGKLIGKSFPIGKDSFIKNFHNWHIPNISQVIEKQKVCLF